MTHYTLINPEQPIPDDFRLLWDFSFLIDDQPTGILWRQRDKKTLSVLGDYSVPIIENLESLFDNESAEISAPAPELD